MDKRILIRDDLLERYHSGDFVSDREFYIVQDHVQEQRRQKIAKEKLRSLKEEKKVDKTIDGIVDFLLELLESEIF